MSGAVPLFLLYAFMVWEEINLPFLIIINVISTAAAAAAAVLFLCVAVSNLEKQVCHMVPTACLYCRNS